MAIEIRSEHRCFGGRVLFCAHPSEATGTTMRFAVFLPEAATRGRVPSLTYLAGLTCSEETFMVKAGAQRHAAEHGLILIAPDTSPRGLDLPGESESWDFGLAAGFYLDATQAPWATHYRMASYIAQELPELIEAEFPADPDRRGLFGHSMGGHGALTLALKRADRYRSLSAFAPIAHPSVVPWGEKALSGYLGPDRAAWAEHDATLLLARHRFPGTILVDQGLADPFLATQLKPEAFEAAARETGQALTLRRHAGYDHGYYFIQSFVADHLAHHAAALR